LRLEQQISNVQVGNEDDRIDARYWPNCDATTTPGRFITVSAANDAIQLELLYDYTSKVALYDEGHRYFRAKPPPMLIVWGQNDPFFTVEGGKAFLRDLRVRISGPTSRRGGAQANTWIDTSKSTWLASSSLTSGQALRWGGLLAPSIVFVAVGS
jgi:hypothetical protein